MNARWCALCSAFVADAAKIATSKTSRAHFSNIFFLSSIPSPHINNRDHRPRLPTRPLRHIPSVNYLPPKSLTPSNCFHFLSQSHNPTIHTAMHPIPVVPPHFDLRPLTYYPSHTPSCSPPNVSPPNRPLPPSSTDVSNKPLRKASPKPSSVLPRRASVEAPSSHHAQTK